MLKRVLILTMDILLNRLLPLTILLWRITGKTDSRVALEFLLFIVDIDTIIDVYAYTMSNPGVLAMIRFTWSIHFVSFIGRLRIFAVDLFGHSCPQSWITKECIRTSQTSEHLPQPTAAYSQSHTRIRTPTQPNCSSTRTSLSCIFSSFHPVAFSSDNQSFSLRKKCPTKSP